MEKSDRVILHGMWASTYSRWVEIALKLKGIPYEYIEEDLQTKSQSLLQLNPVHKKVPVLVHNGKPIAESLVILEYIDETWKNSPRLLPDDPYGRAQVRFWVSYITQQLFESTGKVMSREGEAQAEAVKETRGRIRVLEEGLKTHFSMDQDSSEVGGNDSALVDIILVSTLGVHEAYSEALGVEIIDPVETPVTFSRVERVRELPEFKEVAPPHDMFVKRMRNYRQGRLERAVTSS
ncbi:PREDICTED: glutathione S-transferase U10 [Tarenaya hassleriana]|uniref:glutathione S-transferase U10 n=1 Tax=Tarenaya hassleriana TaxID=28532 RepID=UPI00053C939D|nr:PREDICTED: glutathione S-transferase U10 [Tarenaya hassleriana]